MDIAGDYGRFGQEQLLLQPHEANPAISRRSSVQIRRGAATLVWGPHKRNDAATE